jgi:predicted metalloprotease
VRHDACRWSLEACRGCAGPPGPDLAKRDLNPRIPARVMTISVRVRRCGGAGAREGVGRGEVAQVRHDACRWSLEACRGCAGPPGPDLAKRDLNPRIPARVMTISVRVRRCGGAGAREGVGRGEVAQVRHDACRWSLEACRGCAGPPGPDLAKRDLNPRIPARVMTISVRVRRCGGAGAREGVGRGEVAQVRHDACRWSLEACRGCAGPPGPDLAKRDLNPRIPARVMTISVRVRRCGGAGAREGVGRGEVAQVRHDACRWSLEACRGCAGPPGPDLAKRDLNPRIPARVMTISVRVRRCGGAGGCWTG